MSSRMVKSMARSCCSLAGRRTRIRFPKVSMPHSLRLKMMRLRIMCLLLVCLWPGAAPADGFPGFRAPPAVLPVDDAFRFGSYSGRHSSGDPSSHDGEAGVILFWQVAPGYYLYRDKFEFVAGGARLQAELPRGELRQDETFGEVEVLSGLIEVMLPAPGDRLEVHYQGCAARGYCYPPQKKLVSASGDPAPGAALFGGGR